MLDKQILQYLKNGHLLPVLQSGDIGVLGKPTAKGFEGIIAKAKPGIVDPVILLAELGLLSVYVQEVPEVAWDIIEYSEKALQVIFPQGRGLPDYFFQGNGAVSIRVESKGSFYKLLYNMGSPLVFVQLQSSLHKDVDFLGQYDKVLNLPPNFEWKIKPDKVLALGLKGEIKFLEHRSQKYRDEFQ